ncbi:MAG TPA: STT3 domain-containing protein, partial [Methanoregulaceae archaeon]|nr:STT3 domain-containing protein [Methanoregulaceae archaeon]
MAVAFGVRAIPFIFIGGNGFLNTYDTDTWYTLRQVEVMVSQFPGYPWFDPMTAFPDGKTISWGPLFPFVAGALCLILGATTQPEIVRLTMWISPVLGTLLVPVMYILGKTVWDERAGLVAAGLSTVVSFRFFFLSMYGYVDHHIMELFFSTLFLTVYVVFLSLAKKNPPDIHVPSTLKVPVAVALVSGILYFLALITSTTVLLVIPVIAVFTFVRIVLDYVKDSEPVPLLLLNGIAFSVVTLLLILFGIDGSSFAFTGYSLGLVLVLLSVVAETLVLWVLTRIFQGKPILFVSGIGILALVTAGMALTLPALR